MMSVVWDRHIRCFMIFRARIFFPLRFISRVLFHAHIIDSRVSSRYVGGILALTVVDF